MTPEANNEGRTKGMPKKRRKTKGDVPERAVKSTLNINVCRKSMHIL